MTLWRRHDGYVLRAFLAALGTALLFLTSMVVIYDLADRLDRLPKAFRGLEARGYSPASLLFEYYATLVPFLWLKILPISVLIAAGLSLTWLSRQNEIAPLVCAGIPARRVLRPVLVAAIAITGLEMLARETIVPGLSRRHDDVYRLLADRPGKTGPLRDVPHIADAGGGRLSMSSYSAPEKKAEGAWITFTSDPAVDGARTAYRYPVLVWDAGASRWTAPRGGERYLLSTDTAAAVVPLSAGEPVPLRLGPSLLELTLRQGAALGLSSAELAALAEAHPDRARLRLLLHQQAAEPVSTLVLLLIGLPLSFQLHRIGTFRAFVRTTCIVTAYFLAGVLLNDFGARGTLNPVVAAWSANVLFGALGVVLWTSVDA